MNEKEINKDLVKEESEEIKKVPGKKKRKQHIIEPFAKMALFGFVVATVFGLVTGRWNPFKSRKPEGNAIEFAEKFETKDGFGFEIFKKIGIPKDDKNYGENGEYKYGYKIVDDYKPAGLLKQVRAFHGDKLGIDYDVWMFKNSDYAKEFYQKAIFIPKQYEPPFIIEDEFENGRIRIAYDNEFVNVIIRQGNVVYDAGGPIKWSENEKYTLEKFQKFLDILEIDYQLPTHKEIDENLESLTQ